MEWFVQEWIGAMPDPRDLARVSGRMLGALLVGAIIGWQRERSGKAAGLRTHMLVALGTSTFVIACIESGMGQDALSRVIQGLATGIGFLGAGTILKLADEQQIKGLTTAAGVWLTAALSVAIGLGRFGVTLLGLVMAWIVLTWLLRLEQRIAPRSETRDPDRAERSRSERTTPAGTPRPRTDPKSTKKRPS